MSSLRSPAPSRHPVFFTVRLAERGSTALIDHLDILRNAVRVTLRARPVEILAWVVLPDHMHCVWQMPDSDPNYSQRWGRIKARFSRDACRAGLVPPAPRAGDVSRKGEIGLWQRRFREHQCRTPGDLDARLRYCWMDPVKHGLVDDPMDWVPSSIHRDARGGLVPPGITGGVSA
ncbi:transposase [Rhodobacterales bacterium HKCCE2091]|nr:transposase [Rhodobacterales bacterium HKCCE2091]